MCRVYYKVNGSLAYTEMAGPALNTWWRLEVRQTRVMDKVSAMYVSVVTLCVV